MVRLTPPNGARAFGPNRNVPSLLPRSESHFRSWPRLGELTLSPALSAFYPGVPRARPANPYLACCGKVFFVACPNRPGFASGNFPLIGRAPVAEAVLSLASQRQRVTLWHVLYDDR